MKTTALPNINQDDLVLFYEDCRSFASRLGYKGEILEDFPAWAVEKRMLGSLSREKSLFVDFLRSRLGKSGTASNAMKKAIAEGGAAEVELMVSHPAGQETALMVKSFCSVLHGRDAEIVRLYFFEDFTSKEIGEKIGLTEARVCQLLKGAIERMRKFA